MPSHNHQERIRELEIQLETQKRLVSEIFSSESWYIGQKIIHLIKWIPWFSTWMLQRQKKTVSHTPYHPENRNRAQPIISDGDTIHSEQNTHVTIIIPTRDAYRLLKKCVTSVLQKTTYENYDIIVVNNNTTDPRACSYLTRISNESRIRVVPYPHPFHFAAMNNMAARETNSPFMVFLNNDIEVITPQWLSILIQEASQEMVGAVGCKLLYPNKTIQHAGIDYDGTSFPQHRYRHSPRFGVSDSVRGVVAVTGACMMVRKESFVAIGGFDEQFPNNFNDIDLCLKLKARGYSIVYTPHAELYHREYASRGKMLTDDKQFSEDWQRFSEKWRASEVCL